jgi:hypothetical protein
LSEPSIERLLNKFKTIYSEQHLRKKAFESGFCKRLSKFSPLMFFDSLFYDATSGGTKSYNQMAIEVKSTHGVDISGQGIDQRFNEGAQKYIQGMIGEQLSSQVFQSIDTGWSKHFNRVIMK